MKTLKGILMELIGKASANKEQAQANPIDSVSFLEALEPNFQAKHLLYCKFLRDMETAIDRNMRQISRIFGSVGRYMAYGTAFNLLMEALDPKWQAKHPFYSEVFDEYFAFWQWGLKILLKLIGCLSNGTFEDFIILSHDIISQMGDKVELFLKWCQMLQI